MSGKLYSSALDLSFGCFYTVATFYILSLFSMENPQEGIPIPQTEENPNEADDATRGAPIIHQSSIEPQNQQDYWLWVQLQVLRDRMKGSL